jgi:two-component system, NarL family, response regulator LiaR
MHRTSISPSVREERAGASGALVVDPSRLSRRGTFDVLVRAGVEVVVETSSGEEALEAAGDLTPDLLVVELELPGISGVETIRRVRALSPGTRAVVVTGQEGRVAEAVAAGACAYLLKTSPLGALADALRAAAGGHSLILPAAAAPLLETAHEQASVESGGLIDLSARELEVLRLVAGGRDNAEIAAELFISPSTAKSHVSHILGKLSSQNRLQAAVYAVRCGLV